jgi:hypothetical protein
VLIHLFDIAVHRAATTDQAFPLPFSFSPDHLSCHTSKSVFDQFASRRCLEVFGRQPLQFICKKLRVLLTSLGLSRHRPVAASMRNPCCGQVTTPSTGMMEPSGVPCAGISLAIALTAAASARGTMAAVRSFAAGNDGHAAGYDAAPSSEYVPIISRRNGDP